MAKVETITLIGNKFPCVNIDKPVGHSVKNGNERGDVMLVQALFRYIGEQLPLWLGLQKNQTIPFVTGEFDEATAQAIKSYQRHNAGKLLKSDQIVDPASYIGRNLINLGKNRVMMITRLHFDSFDASLFHNDDNYIAGLTRKFPQLVPWMRVMP